MYQSDGQQDRGRAESGEKQGGQILGDIQKSGLSDNYGMHIEYSDYITVMAGDLKRFENGKLAGKEI